VPRYEYECLDCKENVTITHKVGASVLDNGCPACGSNRQLERVYSFSIKKATDSKAKPGNVVKAHIEEARKELKEEKKMLTKKDFEI